MTEKQLRVFWGCTISDRLPFLEKTTRLVLSALGYDPVTPEGTTCCPDPVYGRALEEGPWLTLAARNLALCRQYGEELMVPCNGCLATFQQAAGRLKDGNIRDKVNEQLKKVGIAYTSPPRIHHILSFLQKIGNETLKKQYTYKLGGIRVGVHYGCHILNATQWAIDTPDNTTVFENILSATGLEVVSYPDKHLCCGASAQPFDAQGSLGLLREKIKGARKASVDAFVLCCPLCFIQFDMESVKLERKDAIPVFYVTEILALALGIPPEELGFDWHATKPKALLSEKLAMDLNPEYLEKDLDLERLKACCGACTFECSAALASQDNDLSRFDPVALVNRVAAGDVASVLEDPDIWRCLKCHECVRICPFGDGLAHFFEVIQGMARRTGVRAEPIEQKLELIRTIGAGVPRNRAIRKEFGLPVTKAIDRDQLEKLLDTGG